MKNIYIFGWGKKLSLLNIFLSFNLIKISYLVKLEFLKRKISMCPNKEIRCSLWISIQFKVPRAPI